MPTATFLDADGLNIYHNGTTINGKKLPATLFAQDIPSKNLLPNRANTLTTNGVTFTVNSDGSVTVNGTASANASLRLCSETVGAIAESILTGCPSGGTTSTYYLGLQVNGTTVTDTGSGKRLSAIASGSTLHAWIQILSGVTCNNLTFRPMIRPASITDDTYIPYAKTNIELSKQIYAQDIPSKNLFNTIKAGFETRNNYGVTRSLASDGTGIVLNGLSTNTHLWARSIDDASLWLPQGDYLISYETSGTGSSSVTQFGVLTSDGHTYYSTFEAPSDGITIVNFVIVVTNNVQYNCTVYPMIRPSTAPSGYVPHAKTNVELTNYLSGAVVVEKITSNDSETLSAGQTSNRIFYIDKAGYTPLGVVGFGGSGTAGLAFSDIYIDTIHTAKAYYTNHTSASKTINSLFVQILYCKN